MHSSSNGSRVILKSIELCKPPYRYSSTCKISLILNSSHVQVQLSPFLVLQDEGAPGDNGNAAAKILEEQYWYDCFVLRNMFLVSEH